MSNFHEWFDPLEQAESHAHICAKLAEEHKDDALLFAALTDAAAIIRDLMRGRLQAEAAGFKVDAERYRWVRAEAYLCLDSDEHDKIAYRIEVPTGVGYAKHTFQGAALPSLDEAIDAAICASREQAK